MSVNNPTGKDSISRGKEIVLALGACGQCHGITSDPQSPLAGGQVFHDLYGEVIAANLTPSASGIGNWSFSDFVKAIREGENPDGVLLSSEYHKGLRWASDADLGAIFAYLHSLQAVDHKIKRREIGFWDRNTAGLLESRTQIRGYVPSIQHKDSYKYGAYLTDHIADCGRCHSRKGGIFSDPEYLGGGQVIQAGEEEKYAPSLAGDPVAGLGSWQKDQLVFYLQTGRTPAGTQVDSRFCPISFYSLASKEDLEAIATYLKSF